MDIQERPSSEPTTGEPASEEDRPRASLDIRKRPWRPSFAAALVLLALLLSAVLVWWLASRPGGSNKEADAAARQARLAEVEEMEGLVRGDWAGEVGPPLDYQYWADEPRKRKTTVRQKLRDIGARIRNGEVVDPNGKVIYFWRVVEFSGAWPDDMRRKVEKGVREMEDSWRLIRMYVGPRRR